MADLMVHVGLGWGVFRCAIKGQYIDFGMPISYTTDAPIDTLEGIRNSLLTNTELHLDYDAEDKGEWFIFTKQNNVFAFRIEESGDKTYELDITKKQLMTQLVSDIIEDIDNWAAFCFDDSTIDIKKQLQDLGTECMRLLGEEKKNGL